MSRISVGRALEDEPGQAGRAQVVPSELLVGLVVVGTAYAWREPTLVPVSTLVNSPKNDDARLIAPAPLQPTQAACSSRLKAKRADR